MIMDGVFSLLVEALGFFSGILPRIPLGPFAVGGSGWATVTELGTKMGWLSGLLPWDQVGIGTAFVMTCAVAALAVFILRVVLRVVKVW